MKKSINQWSFPGEYTLEQCIALAAKAGFAGYEPAFDLEGPLSMTSSDAEAAAVKAMIEDAGMEVASLATGVFWGAPFTSDSPATRARAVDLLKRQIEVAALLGTDAILVVPGLVGADFIEGSEVIPYDKAYDRAQEGIGACVEHAKSAGVKIGIENVWNKFLLSPLEMRSFVDSFGSPYVGAYVDVGNMLINGYPEQWIRILGQRIVRIHIKDFKKSVGTLDGFCPLLEGDVNFPEVINALNEVGYQSFLTAEMNSGVPSEATVMATSRAMSSFMGQ